MSQTLLHAARKLVDALRGLSLDRNARCWLDGLALAVAKEESRREQGGTDLMKMMRSLYAFREQEMQKLAADPSLKGFACQLMDELERALNRLCNYDAAVVKGKGQVPILEVIQEIQADARGGFRKLLGFEYEPEICRRVQARKSPQ